MPTLSRPAILALALGLGAATMEPFPSPLAPAAHAQIFEAPRTVHVPGGSFRETAPGRWVESDRNRTARYTFDGRDRGSTTVLTNSALGVTLWLDRDARTVWGEWPGQPRHRLHTITGIDDMMFPPPEAAPRPSPVPKPVPKPAPEPGPKPSAPATPDTVLTVRASGRHLYRRDASDPRRWTEIRPDGSTGSLRRIGTEAARLYLLGEGDSERLLVIDLARGEVLSAAGDALARRHTVLDAATLPDPAPTPKPPLSPPPPATETLSEAERLSCAASGGVVERAGLLGAERCTLPLSDAGLFCTDSDVCAGTCLAPPGAAVGARVAGTCAATDSPFGCYARVEDGRATPTLCVD